MGEPLILECKITAVRGITSQVVVMWNVNNRKKSVNASMSNSDFVVYRDYYNIPQLTTDNSDITYDCEVTINDVTANNNFTLYVTGEYSNCVSHNHAYACIICSSKF